MAEQYQDPRTNQQPAFNAQPGSAEVVSVEAAVMGEAPDPRRRALLAGGAVVLTGIAVGGGLLALSRHEAGGPDSTPSMDPTQTADLQPTTEAAPTAAPAYREARPGASNNEVTAALDELEQRSGVRFTGAVQYFRVGADAAERRADWWHADALRTQTQAKFGRATTILEPSPGLNVNSPGRSALDGYFGGLRRAGVHDNELGRVVLLPGFMNYEGAKPDFYGHSLNDTAASLRRAFPRAETTALVNVATSEWEQLAGALEAGRVERLRKGTLRSVGVEGFSNDAAVQFDQSGRADVSAYLNPDAIQRVADTFGQRRIWISTGIPREDRALGVTYTTEQRVAIAHGTAHVAAELERRGYIVDNISLLLQNKLEGTNGEGRDFSIPPGEEVVLQAFATRLEDLGITLSGYAAPAT